MRKEVLAEPATAGSTIDQLDALFAPWNRTDAPGLVVGVVKDGALLYRRGFGLASLETAVANTPATRMRIGSTSKHFTCLLALLLAEEGKLDLESPIRTYIPELAGPAGDPTLRELMQHTGGSRCYLDLAFLAHGMNPIPAGAALQTLARQTGRNFAPGEAMIYNNSGCHLLSLAIARVGGAPFARQLRDRLFAPIRMNDTSMEPTDYEIIPGIATMHVPSPSGGWLRGLFPTEELLGEGAIVSTIDDMLRWSAHLRQRDRFGGPKSWTALLTPSVDPYGSLGVYALGLLVDSYRGLRTVHHPGSVMGGSSQMLLMPDHGLDIVILSNGAPGAVVTRLAEQVVDIVLADQLAEPESLIPSDEYRTLLGDWWSADTGMIYSLVDVDGFLKVELCKAQGVSLPLVQKGDGRIISPPLTLGEIEFGLDRAAPGDSIEIAFCGRPEAYRRLAAGRPEPANFTVAVVGKYYSADADATATVSAETHGLVIRLQDRVGAVQSNLAYVGEGVAYTWAPPPAIWHWAVLQFDLSGPTANGFRLNTMRTRRLEFVRTAEA